MIQTSNTHILLSSLPDTNKNVISILSGGLDSATATILLVEKYGKDKVSAISFDYGQKQRIELNRAAELCEALEIPHEILDLRLLGEISRPMSANIAGTDIKMPTIEEVIGDPVVPTYVPNRNMIMYSIVAAAAEVRGAEYIFCGLQSTDNYGYHDTTSTWIRKMNDVLSENRKIKIKIIAPFNMLSKNQEIEILRELGKETLLKHTITCYNPTEDGKSCGRCPSCAERMGAFIKNGIPDFIPYVDFVNWDKLLNK